MWVWGPVKQAWWLAPLEAVNKAHIDEMEHNYFKTNWRHDPSYWWRKGSRDP